MPCPACRLGTDADDLHPACELAAHEEMERYRRDLALDRGRRQATEYREFHESEPGDPAEEG